MVTDRPHQWLQREKKGVGPSRIKWNLTKFLLDHNGQVVDRYGPATKPERLKADIRQLLGPAGS